MGVGSARIILPLRQEAQEFFEFVVKVGRRKADDFKSKMYNIMTSFNLNIQEDAFALGAAAVAHGA